jgi:hypothetical protein
MDIGQILPGEKDLSLPFIRYIRNGFDTVGDFSIDKIIGPNLFGVRNWETGVRYKSGRDICGIGIDENFIP